MSWIMLIISIITSIPKIISVVQEIIALIKSLRQEHQAQAKDNLHIVLSDIKTHGLNHANLEALSKLRDLLKEQVGAKKL
jgi:choline-glycine betaine transporter